MFEIFLVTLIWKIFLDETLINFYFEYSFTSKTYFCDFSIWFALVLLMMFYPISFYTCFTKELLSKSLLPLFFMIFVTHFRHTFLWRTTTTTTACFSIYKRKIFFGSVIILWCSFGHNQICILLNINFVITQCVDRVEIIE